MLKEKNRRNCVYYSMLSPFVKMDSGYIFGPSEVKDRKNRSFQSFCDSTPLIKGEKVSYSEAMLEIKRIIKVDKSIHIDGLSTDLQSMHNILDFAERYNASINHMCADEINIFFSAFQKYGGSFVSFNELKIRSDLVIVIGAKQTNFSSHFYKNLNWSKQKVKKTIFYLEENIDEKVSFCSDTINQVTYLKNFLLNKNKSKNSKLNRLKEQFLKSKFPVVIANMKKKDYALVYSIFDFVRFINKKSRMKIFSLFGSHNSGGFVNACVTKTGYPNAVSFTDFGPIYEPYLILTNKQKKIKNVQIYISNFEPNPKFISFKKNIFIGHPNFVKKRKVDVFIPTKTPGLDTNGLIAKTDNGGILKLNKSFDSTYPTIIELIEDFQKY